MTPETGRRDAEHGPLVGRQSAKVRSQSGTKAGTLGLDVHPGPDFLLEDIL